MIKRVKNLPDIYKFIITLLVAFGGFYTLISREFVRPLNETATRSIVNESNIKVLDGKYDKVTESIARVDSKVEVMRVEQRESENRIIDKIMELK